MPYLDIHSHIYPEKISEKATNTVCDFYDVETIYHGFADELLEVDRKAGIYRTVILPVSVNPVHTESINNFTLREAAEHKEFIPFATMHAENEDMEELTSHFFEQGFFGVKLHPDMQKFNVDDERLFPMYDLMGDKLLLMVHAGDPRYDYSHPRRIKRILHEFPHLRVIAAHFGGWSMQETAFPILKDEERCYTDTSSALSHMTPEVAMKYINGYGVERVMFGSDYPIEDPVENVELINRLPLNSDDFEKITHRNAENLLSSVQGQLAISN